MSRIVSEVTLLCWNVAGRVKVLQEQARHVADAAADVVCLQEVSVTTAPAWRRALSEAGLEYVRVAPIEQARADGRTRPLATLTAARQPLHDTPFPAVPWPERVVTTSLGGLQLVNFHSPTSPKADLAKVRSHEAVHRYLSTTNGPRAVCGDFNTPRREHADGRVWTFARDRYGRLRPERGERWDAAELALIRGLEPAGFRDAFRELHGPAAKELSWEWPRWGGGYRLDHLIVSSDVSVGAVSYLHDWRRAGLSDHSPLQATVSWAA